MSPQPFAPAAFASAPPLRAKSLALPTTRITPAHNLALPSRRRVQPPRTSSAPTATHTPASDPDVDVEAPARTTSGSTLQLHILRSVSELSADEWDQFASAGCNNPFLRHDWLRCLEQSGSATPQNGWAPSHVVLRTLPPTAATADGAHDNSQDENSADADSSRSGPIYAIMPAYLKYHSLGEFVFDQEWAEAAYGAGIEYYPKLLLAVPFTPVSGRRILTPPHLSQDAREKRLQVSADILKQVCCALRISSVHVNFCQEDEVRALSGAGFLGRKGVQYHFTNYRKGRATLERLESRIDQARGADSSQASPSDVHTAADMLDILQNEDQQSREPYRDFEDYLSEFKSKKRIKMRRERNIVRKESGLQIEVVRGTEIDDELMNHMFDIYMSTIDKMTYGRQYLTRRFFQMLQECDGFMPHICLVLARREDNGKVIGGTFNVIGDGGDESSSAFYGRYWGCTQEFRYLHFEACYYAAIEYCIENNLDRMEPGAGGGEFKYMRGFEPSVTMSMHYLEDNRLSDAVARYLRLEGNHVDDVVLKMQQNSALRTKLDASHPSECSQ